MKKLVLKSLFIIFFCSFIVQVATAQKPSNIAKLSLENIVPLVNKSIQEASSVIQGKAELKKAEIALETEIIKTLGGGFKFIAKAEGSRAVKRTSKTTYIYEPGTSSVQDFDEKDFKKLTHAIISAVNAALKASEVAGLELQEIEVELAFFITKEGELGVDFGLFDAVEVKGGGASEGSEGNTITLTFKYLG